MSSVTKPIMLNETGEQIVQKLAEVAESNKSYEMLLNTKADKVDVSAPFNFKGDTTYASLPTSGNAINDTYYCSDKKCRYTWNGEGWYQSSMNEVDYTDELAQMASEIEAVDSKLSSEIENVEIEIRNDLYNVLGAKEVEILTDFEVAKNGKYLEYDTCIEKSYSSYYITVSYFVKKGTIIDYKIGTQETVVIAETDEEQTFYTAIVQYHKKGYCEGTYIAEKDMYVCFCILNTFTENKVTFTYVIEESPIDNNMLNIDALGNNIEILHDNTYVDYLNGTIQSYQGFAVSKSYFVKKGCMVRYRVEVYGCAGFMETDETQSYYKVINGTNTTREVLEDIFYATKDMYVCFGWYKPFGHNSCAISNIESFDYDNVTPKMGNDGLNILVFGDSITDCTNISIADGKTTSYSFPSPSISYIENGVTHNYDKWAYLMQNYLPIKEVRCYAKSGAVYRDRMDSEDVWEERQQLSEQINLAFNDLNNPNGVFNQSRFIPDYVIFALGINDRWDAISDNDYTNTIAKNVYNDDGSLNVESTLNALDRTIFSDSIRWAYLKTKAKFPYAQFFTVLPLQTGNVNAENYIKVRELIERFAKHHSIKILDGGYEMGICSDFDLGGSVGLYLKDSLHPNEYGQNLYTKFIVNAIKSTYIKNDFLNM